MDKWLHQSIHQILGVENKKSTFGVSYTKLKLLHVESSIRREPQMLCFNYRWYEVGTQPGEKTVIRVRQSREWIQIPSTLIVKPNILWLPLREEKKKKKKLKLWLLSSRSCRNTEGWCLLKGGCLLQRLAKTRRNQSASRWSPVLILHSLIIILKVTPRGGDLTC